MYFDLLIQNAVIHDGTGNVTQGDVGVVQDRIATVGTVAAQARRIIDARGRTLAPGFIDIHSHADFAVLREPRHECKVLQGVTTDVFTSCGLGFAPLTPRSKELQCENLRALFGEWPEQAREWRTTSDYLDQIHASVNVAYLVSHGAVRCAVKGYEETAATPDQIRQMQALVGEAVEAGALGLSTGLYYKPMTAATVEETAALAAQAGGLFSIHIRDMGRGLFAALDEALEICARSGVRLQISHLQAIRMNRGRAPDMLHKLTQARERGLDVAADVYPYDAGSTMLSAVRPEEYDDVPWDHAYLVEDGSLIGDKERARKLSGPFVVHDRDEAEVELFVKWPHTSIGSDGLHIAGRPHPRLWGTFPRVLAKWGLDMIPKMTGLSARRLGLTERGLIRRGAAADLVLLSSPRDRATYREPCLAPEGIDLVVVNGVIVAEDGIHTGATPGRVLRR